MIIDGKKIAGGIVGNLMKLPKPPGALAAVLVGDSAESKSFLKQKEKIAQRLGITFRLYEFSLNILEKDLINEIKKLGGDAGVGGIIVQLSLPPHYDRDAVLSSVNPKKDIDALTLEGRKFVSPLPVEVVKDLLIEAEENIDNKNIAVVGRGFLVGKPIMEWLTETGMTFRLFHSKSDLAALKDADLIITGVGKSGLINSTILRQDVGIIDFGYDFIDGKIRGDFIPNENFHGWYTPTPGGTGPILVAEIFKNFYKLNKLNSMTIGL